MPGNSEEKEKCIEKLVQMEKFLPFLDYMINKINKKNYEIPLECQLGKFHLLRSMIAEKNGKYNWDIVVKVEDVIQKLITKLDYKEQYSTHQKEDTSCNVKKLPETAFEEAGKNTDVTVISIPSSTTTTISVTNASTSSRTTMVDSASGSSVGQITSSLKIYIDKKNKNVTEQGTEEASNNSGNNTFNDGNARLIANVDKDSGDSNAGNQNEKITFNGDLLSSSREKLLKSLQQKLNVHKGDSNVTDSNKAIEKSSASAFSSVCDIIRTPTCDSKAKGDKDRTSESIHLHKSACESKTTHERITKPVYSDIFPVEKRSDVDSGRGEYSGKQKLREKLSADICEVYRVSGRSIGGSLRSLKEHKKYPVSHPEEEELFKPDKVTEVRGCYKLQNENQIFDKNKLSGDHSFSKKGKKMVNENSREERSTKNEGKTNKDGKNCQNKKKKDNKEEEHLKTEKKSETSLLGKLDDEELLGLIRENTQSLPHLAKLKLGELRKAVNSSLQPHSNLSDLEGISDDSFKDLDDVLNDLSNISSSPTPESESDLKSSKTSKSTDESVLGASKSTDESTLDASKDELESDAKNDTDDLDDQDFAQRLIEDLNPPAPSGKTKKGLLELPLPCADVPTDPPSTVKSPIPCVSDRDPRKKKLLLQSLSVRESANKPETRTSADSELGRYSTVSKDSKQNAGFKTSNSHVINYFEKAQGVNQMEENRLSHLPFTQNQDTNNFFQYGNRFPSDSCVPTFPNNYFAPNLHTNTTRNEIPKHIPCRPYEARSYAEYKRMKKLETEKLAQQEALFKENESNSTTENSKTPETPAIATEPHCTQQTSEPSSKKFSKTTHVHRSFDGRGKTGGSLKQSESKESSRKKSCSEDFKRENAESKNKIGNDRRISSDSEELVSPLEKLYEGESKPRTGRGYGLQNFKIPKKNREHLVKTSKSQSENASKENKESLTSQSLTANEISETKTVGAKSSGEIDPINARVIDSDEKKNEGNEVSKLVQNSDDSKKVLSSTSEQSVCSVTQEKPVSNEGGGSEYCDLNHPLSPQNPKTIVSPEPVVASELTEVENDSRVENSVKDEGKVSDSSSVISREEITQEFVEALIRKSFESGEGKLLLAQAKLFEEFARKLNSKKLKTIQKIINSESESSTSSDSSSEEEKKKQKGKKVKKRKKKLKRVKKRIITSSSSSTSEESNDEEKTEKKEESNIQDTSYNKGTSLSCEQSKTNAEVIPSSEKSLTKSTDCETIDVGNCISKKKTKRKQGQKILLEQVLNETPLIEEASEQKIKPKPKTKSKTELDRLHDDIRNMFICSGVVTATGQRMCRILKESGGNMNNLDIVKESAKMVKEEKLKKVATRSSRSLKTETRSRSQSLDKISVRDRSKSRSRVESQEKRVPPEKSENNLENFKNILDNQPIVLLHRIDLDNFGYGVKVSENCISFSRLKGRNTAIRNIPFKTDEKPVQPAHPIPRVYLPRNLRKLNRLKEKNVKRGYVGKKLADIVKSLPLKMAKMKHLKIEQKEISKIRPSEAMRKKNQEEQELADLLNYSFVKKRTEYACRLCSKVLTNITSHYKNVHPLSEVLISRLSKAEAKKAKADSTLNSNYEVEEPVSAQENGKPKPPRSYYCRMCNSPKFTDLHAFFIHVSGHTGEYKYQCPAQDCGVTVQTRDDLKLHILQKHAKRRCEMYNKLTEFFVLPTETTSTLFGYLCSLCNFVQLNSQNVEIHVEKEHSFCRHVRVIKIDMSSKSVKNTQADDVEKNISNSMTVGKNNKDFEGSCRRKKLGKCVKIKTYGAHNARKQKNQTLRQEDLSKPQHKNLETEIESTTDNSEVNIVSVKPDVEAMLACQTDGEACFTEDTPTNTEECKNEEKEISPPADNTGSSGKGSATEPEPSQPNTGQSAVKVRVGPLEAQLLENSEVLYKCHVEDCFFSTIIYDLFEKHIRISHATVKWCGVCDICSLTKPAWPKAFYLRKALAHLKHHQNLMEELKMEVVEDQTSDDRTEPTPSQDLESQAEDEPGKQSEPEAKVETESKENQEVDTKPDNTETSNPPKPLLRVRNLLGDRLSTPKDTLTEEGNTNVDTGLVNEAGADSTEDSPMMFTIENVRSLKSEKEFEEEDDDIKIEEICSVPKIPDEEKFNGNKAVLIRPCPTRKIAIRPETSAIPVEVGKIQIVSGQGAIRPVILEPISPNPPLRLVATPPEIATTISNFKMNLDQKRSKLLTILPKQLQPVAAVPTTTNAVVESPKNYGKVRTKVYRPEKNKAPEPEKGPEEASNSSNQSKSYANSKLVNKKRVKDVKVYQEMLTKSKLCHLFKCMSVECSFTCNNEIVFKQHIGLHEARKRVKGEKKCLRTFFFENSSKSKRAYTWQQCAYCCEVLMNSSVTLGQHIVNEHGHCIYQCAYCFYRAVSKSYVEIHQNSAHSQTIKSSSRVIYKCKSFKSAPSQLEALEKQGKRQSVRPYICDQCGQKFFITQDFMSHLTTEHQAVTAYTCHICKDFCLKADRLILHYKLHSYSTYQCPYCLHGTETQKEMLFHLCNFHFSQVPCMYVRALAENQKSSDNHLESLKVIFYESDSLQPECIVDADPEEEVSVDENSSNPALLLLSPDEISNNPALLFEPSKKIPKEEDEEEDINAESKPLNSTKKELATKERSLSVESILPNTHFSPDRESSSSSDSFAMSNDKKGEHPISKAKESSNEPKTPSLEDKSIKINEILANRQHKENLSTCGSKEEKKNDVRKSGEHKLPLMVVTSKSVCVAKNPNVSEELSRKTESEVPSDKNLKIGELLFNLQKKDKNLLAVEKEIPGSETKTEKPLVGVTRVGNAKNVYPGRSIKKACESVPAENVVLKPNVSSDTSEVPNSGQTKENNVIKTVDVEESESKPPNVSRNVKHSPVKGPSKSSLIENSKNGLETPQKVKSSMKSEDGVSNKEKTVEEIKQPVITNVVSLSGKSQDIGESSDSIIITNVCSLSYSEQDIADPNSSKIVVNFQPKICSPTSLKSGTETGDYDVGEEENTNQFQSGKSGECSDTMEVAAESPEVIILEEEKEGKDVLTVILDSDEEKGPEEDPLMIKPNNDQNDFPKKLTSSDFAIRKEMELLREQMASETDCLLFDDVEPEPPKFSPSVATVSTDNGSSPSKESESSLNSNSKGIDESEESKKPSTIVTRTRYGTRKSMLQGDAVDGKKSENESESESKKSEGSKVGSVAQGLVGKDLFVCGNAKCSFRGEEETQLKEHLSVCDFSKESSALTCPHCNRKIKQISCYIEHIKQHGEKKFFCGLCSYSTTVDYGVIRHLKQKHKCQQYKTLPKESSSQDRFIFYPRNYKTEKQNFEEKGYSPGDEDKLPLQSVYQVNVKCAKCPYFTKVRSNMVRHLKIHAKSAETEGSVVVPSTAPTNPVPCLDTKEKMFDKMTNLAASSQLAKERIPIEGLSPEEEAKLPQFIAEQMRYKCCLFDCNYITIDDGMLKHHIKALHDEINYYSCPHCKSTVHVDVRNVTLDKIGHHLKHHDARLYKCAHCIYFHYQKNIVEKHTVEKHPDRRFFVHTVREPKNEVPQEELPKLPKKDLPKDTGASVNWKCGLCEFQSKTRVVMLDHLMKKHNTRSKYKCKLCLKKSNHNSFSSHFASKHPGKEVEFVPMLHKIVSTGADSQSCSSGAESSSEHFDTTPLWQRDAPRVRHIRGILIEEEEVKTKKSKRVSGGSESEVQVSVSVGNAFYCPLCSDKKKIFYTRNADCFRSHLYQELNYQQYACILCGKMFVDIKDFDKHHAKMHPDKPICMKQTKEDGEIMFWVDKVIAKQEEQMRTKKRKLSEEEEGSGQGTPKKKKQVPATS